jgi:predicted HAD superfamily Cof-like phosphohydrolase
MADLPKSDNEKLAAEELEFVGHLVSWISSYLEHKCEKRFDQRTLRAHLILEEASEILLGMARRHEDLTVDGLADLVYVVAGTAVAFDLPLAAAFKEVQRSNMTKAVRNKDDLRLRDKGAEYTPPDIERVLKEHRHAEAHKA